MASTTVSGGAVSVTTPSVPSTATGSSPGSFVDVMAIGSSSDPQSEDGEDQTRREHQNTHEDGDMDDQRPRMSPTKRRLEDPEMDFGQTAKKRRKQYKPVRIALPVPSNIGEDPKTLSTVYVQSGPGIVGPEDEGYEGEEDGEFAMKYDDVREGLQARLSGGSKPLSSGNLQQDFEKPESSFDYKCFDCSEVFPSSEALEEHENMVHRRKTRQDMPVQLAPSTEAVNQTKRDAPLDLAQCQTPNPTPQPDFPGGSWSSGNPGNSSSDNLPVSIASPSQLPPIPFPMNPFSDGKILIPNLLGLAPPFLLPHIPEKSPTAMASQTQSSVSTGNPENSSSTIRIFNPEAYCELCNKEFCNKYFLKTHKANKHGIYSDTHAITAGSNLPGVSFSSSFTQPMPSVIPSRTVGSNASFSTQKTQTELNNLPKSTSIVQIKINCEVCHKKFNNRYVALRHKAKVHGLVEDSLIGPEMVGKIGVEFWPRFERDEHGNTSTSSETGSLPLDTGNEANTPGQMDIIGDSRPFSREKSNVSPQVSMNKSSPSMNFKLSPSNSVSEFNMDVEETKQQFQPDFSANQSVLEANNSTAQTPMPPNTWAPYQVSPSTSTAKIPHLSQNHLRKMGVVNADAFCEICCKEYCNKYFLRTHKLKRHGIVTPEFDAKSGVSTPGRGAWNQVQTSPLNLIVGEQSGSNWNTVDRSAVSERPINNDEVKKEGFISNGTSSTQTDLPESDKLECNVCGRHFQSHYLMQMHKAYMHPPPSSEGNNEEINFSESTSTKAHTSSSNSNGSTTREDQSPNSNNQGPTLPSENSPPPESNTVNQNDYASGNLQKIQTMIMQLNKLNEGKTNCCTICNKEVEDKCILRSHMVTEHGVVIEDDKDLRDENSSESSGQQGFPSAYCSICKKDFFAKCFLKKHITEFHGNMLPKIMKEELKDIPERVSNSTVEKRVSVTPTSSYCEICNKELCNKYFMKTHMQRMHGIEIENGSQIGGVICDICNKELCSKYFLRVHKQNTHGIVEDSGILQQGKDNSSSSQGTPPGPGIGAALQDSNDLSLKPSDAGDLTHRYFTHFTEVCPICNRRFRSTKWLKAHLMNDHSEIGIEKWKEIEMQYQLHLQQTRQAMTKTQTSLNFIGKSNQSHENDGANTPTQTWKANIGTQSELSMSYSEAGGSSGMRRYSNEMGVTVAENIVQNPGNYGCDQNKEQKKSESNSIDGGNEGEKLKASHSSLFNAGESTAAKNYHCSFCPFRTPVLAYLFVHEKTHAGLSPPPMPGAKKQMECPICHMTFVHSDMFHHHLVNHQYSGIIGSITTGVPMQQNYNQSSENFHNSPGSQQKQGDNAQDDDFQNLREPIVEVVVDETGDVLGGEESSTCKFKCPKCTRRFKSQELLLIHAQNKESCLCKEVGTSPPNQEATLSPYSPNNNEPSNACPIYTTPSAKPLPVDTETFKCMQSPFATEQIATLKKHIIKEHPEETVQAEPTCPVKGSEVPKEGRCSDIRESDRMAKDWVTEGEMRASPNDPVGFDSGELEAAMELRRRLEEAARQSQVPASYAVPQRVRLREEGLGRSSFIMQPFLLEEPEESRRSPGDGTCFQPHSINGKFVPSLVFLPVREKLSKPLTVSFSLTPA